MNFVSQFEKGAFKKYVHSEPYFSIVLTEDQITNKGSFHAALVIDFLGSKIRHELFTTKEDLPKVQERAFRESFKILKETGENLIRISEGKKPVKIESVNRRRNVEKIPTKKGRTSSKVETVGKTGELFG